MSCPACDAGCQSLSPVAETAADNWPLVDTRCTAHSGQMTQTDKLGGYGWVSEPIGRREQQFAAAEPTHEKPSAREQPWQPPRYQPACSRSDTGQAASRALCRVNSIAKPV